MPFLELHDSTTQSEDGWGSVGMVVTSVWQARRDQELWATSPPALAKITFLKDSQPVQRFPVVMSSTGNASGQADELLPTRRSLLDRLRN